VWNVRGGGLYACGFAATFVYLEIGSLIDDFREVGLLLDGRVVAFIINFVVDSLHNTLGAFLWPVNIVQFATPWGAIGLGLAFALFPKFLKKPIERWLFANDPKKLGHS
jgi:hypothetical protein